MPANRSLGMEDTDILDIIDDVIMNKIVPEMVSLRQNYFITTSVQSLTEGVDTYPIPYRALGRTLMDLKLQDSSGEVRRDLSQINLEEIQQFTGISDAPSGFYFLGDKLKVLPKPANTGDSLLMYWELPPAKGVTVGQAAKIISHTGDDITVESVPDDITVTTDVDLIEGKQGYSTYAMDLDITAINGNTITFATGSLDDYTIVAGDYISVIETSPVVQLPRLVIPFVETLAGKRILQSIGDFEGAKDLLESESDELKQMRRALEPRIRNESIKIKPNHGLLRRRGYRHRLKGNYY